MVVEVAVALAVTMDTLYVEAVLLGTVGRELLSVTMEAVVVQAVLLGTVVRVTMESVVVTMEAAVVVGLVEGVEEEEVFEAAIGNDVNVVIYPGGKFHDCVI